MFEAAFDEKRGWRVCFNGIDICGAINEAVARETAFQMNAYRSVVP